MSKTLAAAFVFALAVTPALAEEPDGLVLPPGFHASVVADGLTGLRHITIRDNGDIYASTAAARGAPPPGVIALHLGADHKVVTTERFGSASGGTGIRIYRGALYVSSPTSITRYALDSALVPTSEPQVIVDGMPAPSANRPIAFDGKGNLFVALTGTGNNCADPAAPKTAKPVGLKPCPDLATRAGVWRFDATKAGQKFPSDGEQIATGNRNISALEWSQGALYGVMHGRDSAHETWPDLVSATDDDNIGDEMHRIVKGTDMGWPYSYYDGARGVRLVAPEYGGDGKTQAPAGLYATPVASFYPMRPAVLELAFYNGTQFPRAYRGGAFVVTHGGTGAELPTGRGGYNVVFVPFTGGKAGKPQPFADGFAGPTPADKNGNRAKYRPVGGAVGPDGALYVADSQKGRIWRISYGG